MTHVWTEPGQCSSCKHCAMDLDMDPFCVHPKVKEFHRYGVNLTKAITDFCGDELKLREASPPESVEKKREGESA